MFSSPEANGTTPEAQRCHGRRRLRSCLVETVSEPLEIALFPLSISWHDL